MQHEWLSLAVDDGATADAFSRYSIPSMLPMPVVGVLEGRWGVPGYDGHNNGTDLAPGWEAVLTRFAQEEVLPRLANKTAIGVFLGDELCCHNSTCWHRQLYPLAAKLRSLLPASAVLWENDCGDSIAGGCDAGRPACEKPLDRFPDALDWVSIDMYDGYAPGSNGSAEAANVRAWATKHLFPRMNPRQKIVVVPGTFACSNTSYISVADSSQSVVAKLRAYMEWGKFEPRMAAICPWHFNMRHHMQHEPPCDMRLGAVDMPDVLSELASMGQWIKAHRRRTATTASMLPMATAGARTGAR